MTIIHGRFTKRRQLGQGVAIALAGFAIGVVAFLAVSIDWRTILSSVDGPARPKPPISVSIIEVIDGDTVRSGAWSIG